MFRFNENQASVSPEQASPGPMLGPLESMSKAYDLTIRDTDSSIREQMGSRYKKQQDLLRDAGDYNAPALPSADPMALARYYSLQDEDPRFDLREVELYDKKIEELKAKHPKLQLQTTREMWGGVQQEYQELSQQYDAQPTGVMGGVAGFAGSMAGSVDPRYNALNFASIFAPVGKAASLPAILGREALVNAGAETINEAAGAAANREALGGDGSFGSSVTNIFTAGAAGAVFRGIGEAGARGLKATKRRWFEDTVDDPAPPPPPEAVANLARDFRAAEAGPRTPEPRLADELRSSTSMGDRIFRSRITEDTTHVASRLDDWGGESPGRIPPPGVKFADDVATRRAVGDMTVDETARQIDPKTFSIYDKLAGQKNQLRNFIESKAATAEPLSAAEMQTVRAAIDDVSTRINDITEQTKAAGLSKRKRADLDKRIDSLTAEREAQMMRLNHIAGPEVSVARAKLVDVDYKMRDMAAPVSRAYARARGEWALTKEYKDAVGSMIKEGAGRINDMIPEKAKVVSPVDDLATRAPILQSPYAFAKDLGDKATPMDYAKAVVDEESKILDESIEAYRTGLQAALKEGQEELELAGTDMKIPLSSRIAITLDDGTVKEVTVRQMLEDNLNTEYELKAVTTCST